MTGSDESGTLRSAPLSLLFCFSQIYEYFYKVKHKRRDILLSKPSADNAALVFTAKQNTMRC